MEGRQREPADDLRAVERFPRPGSIARVEVVPRSRVPAVSEYELLFDSAKVGELEWIGGPAPEIHLDTDVCSGMLGLRRLRPFVLHGSVAGPASRLVQILHVGSAGQGLIEAGGVQYARRTGVLGGQVVRDQEARILLSSAASSGRRLLFYERSVSNLDTDGLLELLLVEAFIAIYTGRQMIRSMLTAWTRMPKMGVPLTQLPAVRRLQIGAG